MLDTYSTSVTQDGIPSLQYGIQGKCSSIYYLMDQDYAEFNERFY
jgi:hypothetical protein